MQERIWRFYWFTVAFAVARVAKDELDKRKWRREVERANSKDFTV